MRRGGASGTLGGSVRRCFLAAVAALGVLMLPASAGATSVVGTPTRVAALPAMEGSAVNEPPNSVLLRAGKIAYDLAWTTWLRATRQVSDPPQRDEHVQVTWDPYIDRILCEVYLPFVPGAAPPAPGHLLLFAALKFRYTGGQLAITSAQY